jgi:hypothetical protein
MKARIINPARKRIRKKGVMPAGLAKYWATHRRKKRKIVKPKSKKKIFRKKSILVINPKQGVKKMKRRRKSSKRRIRHNPSGYTRYNVRSIRRKTSRQHTFVDMLIDGGLITLGAILGNRVNKLVVDQILPATSGSSRNILNVGLALVEAYFVTKFVSGEKGKSLAHGLVGGAMLSLAKNMLNIDLGFAGETAEPQVDAVVQALLGTSDVPLLGTATDISGTSDISGEDFYSDMSGDDDDMEGEEEDAYL